MKTPGRRDVWAVDAAAMLHTGTRRLLCAVQELTGGELVVVAEVWQRVWTAWEQRAQGAADQEVRAIRRGGLRTRMEEAELAAALREAKCRAGRAWLEEEPGRGDAPWRYRATDGEESGLEEALSQSGLFREGSSSDGRIVAQALVAGAERLLAAKMDGVMSGELNAWIEERRERREEERAPWPAFLTDPDAALMEKAERTEERGAGSVLVGWMRAAWAPDGERREDAARVHGALKRSARAAARDGLASVAGAAVRTLDDWGPEGLAERMEGMPKAEATMRSETRLAAKERELRREARI